MRQHDRSALDSRFLSLSPPILVVLCLSMGCASESKGNKNTAEVGGTAGSIGVVGGGASGGASFSASGGSNSVPATGGVSTGTTGASTEVMGGTSSKAAGGGAAGGTINPSVGGSAASTGGTTSATAKSSVGTGGTVAGTGGKGSVVATGGVTSTGSGGSSSGVGGKSAGSGGVTNVATGGTTGAGGAGKGVRWVGRVEPVDANSARFAWQGAGVIATVSGSSIAVKLRTEDTDTVYFQPVIDHDVLARFNVDSGADRTVTLATGLDSGDHLVELYRETEGYYGVSTFLGFTTGTVKGAPASDGRLLEVVGDSISAGYGNLGSELHPNWVANPACHWTASNSSWYATYGAVAGHALGVEVSSVAASGWGMVRDNTNDKNNVLPKVYANALGTSDATAWSFAPKASVVVINLGTNDWADGDPGTSYETAYVQFIATVRSHYPDAWIFLVIGSLLGEPDLTNVKTRLANVVSKVQTNTGDTKLATFDLGVQDMGVNGEVPTGCDWHPNVADHERMASILQGQLTEKLGWQP